MTLACAILASPVGALKLVASEDALVAILWEADDPARVRLNAMVEDPARPVLVETAAQLRAYFERRLTAFALPLDFKGSDFQQAVWTALLAIPFGETLSYGEVARSIGRPEASRAVGAANGRNPISIVAPCHRVVGATGAPTGFAGGIAAKTYLLDHERGTLFSRRAG